METLERLRPINNGQFNEEMTTEQLTEMPYQNKKDVAWHLIHKLSSDWCPFNFDEVEISLHKPQTPKFKGVEITPENVDTIIAVTRDEFDAYKRQMKQATAILHRAQGKEIADMQKALRFGGQLEMSAGKLIGYLETVGHWNDCDPKKIRPAIEAMEISVPRTKYGINNCNNGTPKHKWTVKGDYVTMKFDYLSGDDERAKYLDFYKNHWQKWQYLIKADSCRYELIESGDKYTKSFSLEFIYWWD